MSTGPSYINQNVSFARRRVIHVQRVAALRDLISAV
jgi:putative transposase